MQSVDVNIWTIVYTYIKQVLLTNFMPLATFYTPFQGVLKRD